MTERAPLLPISDSQLQDLEEATKSYEDALTVEAAGYLSRRGIWEETALTYRLGVVANPLPQHQRYIGWLALPYIVRGRVVQIRFRCLQNHNCKELSHGKYGQPTGEPLRVFGVDAIHRASDTLHVTEGEFDAMILNQHGLPAVAMPGASSWQSYHGRMLAGFNRIWVWGDPDAAGAEFVQQVVNRLPRSARGVRLRDGDVTETYLNAGRDPSVLYDLIKT